MYETIKTLYNDDDNGKRRKLYLAGHSLGGALATNAAARLAFIDDFNIAGIYTIGSPRYITDDGVVLFHLERATRFDNAKKTYMHDSHMKHKLWRSYPWVETCTYLSFSIFDDHFILFQVKSNNIGKALA